MPSLITQPDGSVVWDYDLPTKPTKKTAAKKASATPKSEEE